MTRNTTDPATERDRLIAIGECRTILLLLTRIYQPTTLGELSRIVLERMYAITEGAPIDAATEFQVRELVELRHSLLSQVESMSGAN